MRRIRKRRPLANALTTSNHVSVRLLLVTHVALSFSSWAAERDNFGVAKIYADAQRPVNNWTFSGDVGDKRLFEQSIVAAGDGWFRSQHPDEMRFEILSDPSANEDTIPTFDVSKVLERGYLYKPPRSPDEKGDFLNIEQTWRFRVIETAQGTQNGGPHLELVPGGYRQTSSKRLVGRDHAVPASCETMSYHFNLYPLTGRAKFEKDSDHTAGYTIDSSDPQRRLAVAPFADGRVLVEKAVLYRSSRGMKLELYVDETGRGDQFKLVLEYEDTGLWGPTVGGNSECHCSEYVVLSMARVAIGYRADNMKRFVFRDMSIRSIDPSRRLQPVHGFATTNTSGPTSGVIPFR
jgi:hypothetical protein